jgi:Tol biopolymer transport system component
VAPVGNHLVYTRMFTDDNIYRFEALDKTGRVGPPRKLIASTRNDEGPDYSPDGRSIVFFSSRSGTQEIWLCNADGSNPRQLTSMGGPLTSNPVRSPDGRWVYYAKAPEAHNSLWRMPVAGGEEQQMESGHMSWYRNSIVLDEGIYLTKTGGTLEFIDLKSGKTRTITRVEKQWSLGLAISPDHRWTLCSIMDQTLNDLMLVENFRQ